MSAMNKAIDHSRFAAPGSYERPVVMRRRLAASPERVFSAFTDSELLGTWLEVPAKVELAVGGAFELLFDLDQPEGRQGSEGCQILAFIPNEMLAFTWNSPPSLPEARGRLTFVVLQLARVADGTILTLSHAGHGEGELWDQNRRYFERAWGIVLDALEEWLAATK